MEQKINLLFLNGAGGTGKSSIITELKKIVVPEEGWHFYYSSTRATYARLGFTDETTSLQADPQARIDLQLAIMEDERKGIEQLVNTIRNENEHANPVLVVDRGPLNRMAYYLLTMKECAPGPITPFYDMLKLCTSWMDGLRVNTINHVLAPYPVPWATEDQFRDTNYLQTLELALLTEAILSRYAELQIDTKSYYLNDRNIMAGSAEKRAHNIHHLMRVKQTWV